MSFWTKLDKLVKTQEIIIDRPKGSPHPRFPEIIYPLDYGYLKDTSSGDGSEIDIWKGSIPGKSLVAIICTVDTKKLDSEVKLLIGCTGEEIIIINNFYNHNRYMSGIIIRRDLFGR